VANAVTDQPVTGCNLGNTFLGGLGRGLPGDYHW